jgi:hypothetical protein
MKDLSGLICVESLCILSKVCQHTPYHYYSILSTVLALELERLSCFCGNHKTCLLDVQDEEAPHT